VFLQQDAYDPVDVTTPVERQHALLELLWAAASDRSTSPSASRRESSSRGSGCRSVH